MLTNHKLQFAFRTIFANCTQLTNKHGRNSLEEACSSIYARTIRPGSNSCSDEPKGKDRCVRRVAKMVAEYRYFMILGGLSL